VIEWGLEDSLKFEW